MKLKKNFLKVSNKIKSPCTDVYDFHVQTKIFGTNLWSDPDPAKWFGSGSCNMVRIRIRNSAKNFYSSFRRN